MAINTITASGNIGKDCELRVTPNGKNVAKFSLPIKQGFGEHEKTSWVSCKLFGATAEKLTQYLTKGTKVTVSGQFVMEKWQDQNGVDRSHPVIIVRDVDFGGGKRDQSWGQPQQPSSNGPPAKSQQQAAPQYNEPPMDFDDDIPFIDPYRRTLRLTHSI